MTDFLQHYINTICIERAPPGSNYLKGETPGHFYTWQFYLRRAVFQPPILKEITKRFFDMIGEDTLQQVQLAGVESSATAMLMAFQQEAFDRYIFLNVFSIRKTRKAHGLQNWIEGTVNEKPVLLVDDILSEARLSRSTLLHAEKILDLHRITLHPECFVLVHKAYYTAAPTVKLEKTALKVNSLFNLNDFDLSHDEFFNKKEKQSP